MALNRSHASPKNHTPKGLSFKISKTHALRGGNFMDGYFLLKGNPFRVFLRYFIYRYIQRPTPSAWEVLLAWCAIKSHITFGMCKVFYNIIGADKYAPYKFHTEAKTGNRKGYPYNKQINQKKYTQSPSKSKKGHSSIMEDKKYILKEMIYEYN